MRTGFTHCGIILDLGTLLGTVGAKIMTRDKVIVSSMGWMISAIDDEGKVPLVLALNCDWL